MDIGFYMLSLNDAIPDELKDADFEFWFWWGGKPKAWCEALMKKGHSPIRGAEIFVRLARHRKFM